MRLTPVESMLFTAIGAVLLLSASEARRAIEKCRILPREESAKAVEELALIKRQQAIDRTVCFFDFDETLVNTSIVVGRYKGIALYKGIPYMIRLFHELQKHSRMVIITARSPGAEVVVIQNCRRVGIKLKPSDVVVTCPATQKAAWRRTYARNQNLRALVVAGDQYTDVNGPANSIALHVMPAKSENIVCGNCTSLPNREQQVIKYR